MANIRASLHITKRWFFWPALVTFLVFGKLGIIKNPDSAGKWLADNAMRLEVR